MFQLQPHQGRPATGIPRGAAGGDWSVVVAELLNGCGLVLDIAGLLFLYKYGLPSEIQKPSASEGFLLVFPGQGLTEQEKKKQEEMFSYYRRMSRYGLFLILVGFVLLLIGNFL